MAVIRGTEQICRDNLICEKCRFQNTICKFADSVANFVVTESKEIISNAKLPLESYYDCKYMEDKDSVYEK